MLCELILKSRVSTCILNLIRCIPLVCCEHDVLLNAQHVEDRRSTVAMIKDLQTMGRQSRTFLTSLWACYMFGFRKGHRCCNHWGLPGLETLSYVDGYTRIAIRRRACSFALNRYRAFLEQSVVGA